MRHDIEDVQDVIRILILGISVLEMVIFLFIRSHFGLYGILTIANVIISLFNEFAWDDA